MVRGKRKTLGIFGFVVYADRANVPLASVQELKMIKHRSCTLDTSSSTSKFHVLLLLTHLQVPHPPSFTSSRGLSWLRWTSCTIIHLRNAEISKESDIFMSAD